MQLAKPKRSGWDRCHCCSLPRYAIWHRVADPQLRKVPLQIARAIWRAKVFKGETLWNHRWFRWSVEGFPEGPQQEKSLPQFHNLFCSGQVVGWCFKHGFYMFTGVVFLCSGFLFKQTHLPQTLKERGLFTANVFKRFVLGLQGWVAGIEPGHCETVSISGRLAETCRGFDYSQPFGSSLVPDEFARARCRHRPENLGSSPWRGISWAEMWHNCCSQDIWAWVLHSGRVMSSCCKINGTSTWRASKWTSKMAPQLAAGGWLHVQKPKDLFGQLARFLQELGLILS